MKLLSLCVAFAATLAGVASAQAQAYPSRPITIDRAVPGRRSDRHARAHPGRSHEGHARPAARDRERDRRRRRPSASAARCRRRPTATRSIVGNWTSHVGAGALYPVQWNVLNDLEPVAALSASSLMIVGKTALPANNAKELIAWLKANPDKASAASVGAGSGAHICGLYFQEKTGTRFQFVPYRGGAPAMQDLIAGQIDLMCAEASQTLAHVRAGKMKAFAVMSKARWAPLPDVPTMEEVGRRRHADFVLARPVGAQGHAEGRHRQAQRRGRGGLRRSDRAQADRGSGPDHPAARRS